MATVAVRGSKHTFRSRNRTRFLPQTRSFEDVHSVLCAATQSLLESPAGSSRVAEISVLNLRNVSAWARYLRRLILVRICANGSGPHRLEADQRRRAADFLEQDEVVVIVVAVVQEGARDVVESLRRVAAVGEAFVVGVWASIVARLCRAVAFRQNQPVTSQVVAVHPRKSFS
nr:hypothetical protein Itr_chr01CG18120 [Ipomoea trifida]